MLHRVSAAGGMLETITALNAERREHSHRWPHFLPDGRHFLFTARSDVKENNNMIYVGSLDSREVTPLLSAQSGAVYAAPGYILYAQEGSLPDVSKRSTSAAVRGRMPPVYAAQTTQVSLLGTATRRAALIG